MRVFMTPRITESVRKVPAAYFVSLVSALPNIGAVRAEKDRCVAVNWKGGAESVIDLSQHLGQCAVFAPLRSDDDLFRTVRVGEWGWSVHWSDEMEVSADTLWRLGGAYVDGGCT